MKVLAAFLLAHLGGNSQPCAGDIKKILGSVGAEAEDDMIELLLTEVQGKDINELVAAGLEKLASVPAGGGAGVPVTAVSGGGGAAAAAPAAAEPKKEEKVEEKEESDDDMGFSLFD
ncbi:large ribosomal subunit protein P2B-like [Tasmannia lanceolata]|uniref:large ribosomal subunit protein P2B-like n=1 Tax=Tasmannia lanceolata TaxID=3420 RepID=UPI004062D336